MSFKPVSFNITIRNENQFRALTGIPWKKFEELQKNFPSRLKKAKTKNTARTREQEKEDRAAVVKEIFRTIFRNCFLYCFT